MENTISVNGCIFIEGQRIQYKPTKQEFIIRAVHPNHVGMGSYIYLLNVETGRSKEVHSSFLNEFEKI